MRHYSSGEWSAESKQHQQRQRRRHRINFNANSFTLPFYPVHALESVSDRRAVISRCLFYAYVDSALNYGPKCKQGYTFVSHCCFFCFFFFRRKRARLLFGATVEGVPKSLFSISFSYPLAGSFSPQPMRHTDEVEMRKKGIKLTA